jgi:SAM-dependent methyltransferase
VEGSGDGTCWCGGAIEGWSPDYGRCARCATLVWRPGSRRDHAAVVHDEAADLYGLNYFIEHAKALGHPDLFERSRADLSERCVFWLKTLLRHRPPPARTLELGCANGAFVATLASAGYDATGLDLSPAITDYVRRTFEVPVLTGPLEAQQLPAGSVDVLVMMDVLEHLPDPFATLAVAARVLAEDGLLLVQTPKVDPAETFPALAKRKAPFLEALKPREHLLLYSEASVRELLGRAGFAHVIFEPANFPQLDMFLLASRRRVPTVDGWREALRRTRSGRMVEALVDAYDAGGEARVLREELAQLRGHVEGIERDRAARLEEILLRDRRLEEVERDRQAREGEFDRFRATATAELERLRDVEGAHEKLLRRLGPLRRLFDVKSRSGMPGAKP